MFNEVDEHTYTLPLCEGLSVSKRGPVFLSSTSVCFVAVGGNPSAGRDAPAAARAAQGQGWSYSPEAQEMR